MNANQQAKNILNHKYLLPFGSISKQTTEATIF